MLMSEWHVTPDYIANNWSEELLDLMIEKLGKRYERMNEKHPPKKVDQDHWVSDDALFAELGRKIKVEKRGSE